MSVCLICTYLTFLAKPRLVFNENSVPHNTPAGTAFTDCGNFSILRSYEYFYDAERDAVDFDERFACYVLIIVLVEAPIISKGNIF